MQNTAILRVDSPNRKGLVARIADFVYRRGANIVQPQQHDDLTAHRFLMRVEWDLDSTEI